MKKLFLVIILLLSQKIFAQNVGIGTLSPEASAALHVNSSNKGVLFPRVSLTSLTDNTTIPNPANSLLIYNTNFALKYGAGFYYNAGGPGGAQSTKWESVGKQFALPFYGEETNSGSLFEIRNTDNSNGSAAIKGSGVGLAAGVIAESSGGLALDVKGKVKIAGNGQVPGKGKVLTSDASGNASWLGAIAFSASGISAGIVPSGIETKVPFKVTKYDLGDNYTNINGNPHSTFIVPVDGIYHFDVKIIMGFSVQYPDDKPAGVNLIATLGDDTAITLESSSCFKSAGKSNKAIEGSISTDWVLSAGDKIHVTVWQNTGDQGAIDANGRFAGHLVVAR